jgi:hypothetical protein
VNDDSEARGRAAFWAAFLGPVGFGLVAGLVQLFLPWLSSGGINTPPADRFSAPVISGIAVAIVLQVGRWWLYGRGDDRTAEAVKTLCAVTLLVVAFAAGLSILLDPAALLMFLPLLLFVSVLLLWPRRKAIQPRDKHMGIYGICILSFIVSGVSISMSLIPA